MSLDRGIFHGESCHIFTPVSDTGIWNTEEYMEIFILGIPEIGNDRKTPFQESDRSDIIEG